ncbi:cuticle protein 19.8-like [Neocloeon triangulifer]|uniref:cuticle protein 19.8-like n=1 Tax=Neocloeon triangulifer TaxID=2078957 RepID=UPI00286FAA48|nr:cuticle protein 19.8-like [Neocloeon triangulifer]
MLITTTIIAEKKMIYTKFLALLLTLSAYGASAQELANRLSTVEWEAYHDHEHQGPGSYAYGYDVQDPLTGNVQFKEESRKPDGTVRGSYGLVEPDGNVRIVHYVADSKGFRVRIENSAKPDEFHPAQRRIDEAPVHRRLIDGKYGQRLLRRPIVVGPVAPTAQTQLTAPAASQTVYVIPAENTHTQFVQYLQPAYFQSK